MSLPFCCVFRCVTHSSSWTQTANCFDQNVFLLLFFFSETENRRCSGVRHLATFHFCCVLQMYSTDQSVKFAYSMWILPLGGALYQNKTKHVCWVSCGVGRELATWGALTLSYPYRAQAHLTGLWGSNLIGHGKDSVIVWVRPNPPNMSLT